MKHKYKSGAYCFIKNPSHPLYFKNLEFDSYSYTFAFKQLGYIYVKDINTKTIYSVNINNLKFYCQE